MKLITKNPLALDSPDYYYPAGTVTDNTTNINFNKLLYSLFEHKPISVLDLGCSGGGFIYNCICDGHVAYGLEGSDYSKKIGRACWPLIPENLLTCDVSKDFMMIDDEDKIIKFDAITMWDVLEHFKENELPVLFNNINKHLKDSGIFFASIAMIPDIYNPVHQTVKDHKWWLEVLKQNGLEPDIEVNKVIKNNFLRNPYPQDSQRYEDGVLVGADTFCSGYRKTTCV